MSMTEEPEWIVDKQTSDRSFRNAALGVWLACFPVALIMMVVSVFEYGARMWLASAMFLLTGLACTLLRRRVGKGSLMRAFSTTLAALGFVASTVTFSAAWTYGI